MDEDSIIMTNGHSAAVTFIFAVTCIIFYINIESDFLFLFFCKTNPFRIGYVKHDKGFLYLVQMISTCVLHAAAHCHSRLVRSIR